MYPIKYPVLSRKFSIVCLPGKWVPSHLSSPGEVNWLVFLGLKGTLLFMNTLGSRIRPSALQPQKLDLGRDSKLISFRDADSC